MKKGFTLIELVMVILILGIISAVILLRTPSLPTFRSDQAAYKIKSDIRYAQSYALTAQKRTRISFDVGAETYTVYYESSPGNWTIMTDPLKKSNFVVDFTEQEFKGIDIISTDFAGTNFGLVFDAAGIPYGYNPSDGSTAALSSEGSVSISGSISIKVEPNTGKVTIE